MSSILVCLVYCARTSNISFSYVTVLSIDLENAWHNCENFILLIIKSLHLYFDILFGKTIINSIINTEAIDNSLFRLYSNMLL